jgi:hypothetical protein
MIHQRNNRSNERYTYMKGFTLRNWLIRLWKLACSKSEGRAISQKTQEELICQLKSKGHLLEEVPLVLGRSIFCCILVFNWLNEVHSNWKSICFTQNPAIQMLITLTETPRTMFDQRSGYSDPVKLKWEQPSYHVWLKWAPVPTRGREVIR